GVYHWLGVGGVHEHPYTELAQQPLGPAEWALLLLAAVVVAPVWEELVFRGVLQNAFAALPWGGHVAMAVALAWAVSASAEKVLGARAEGAAGMLREAVPVLALLALVPAYLAVWAGSRTPVGPALFGTAVLFAWVHARAWPQPLALLPLGLGLGYLAWRTRSLVAPAVVHALFNATACALLLAQALGR